MYVKFSVSSKARRRRRTFFAGLFIVILAAIIIACSVHASRVRNANNTDNAPPQEEVIPSNTVSAATALPAEPTAPPSVSPAEIPNSVFDDALFVGDSRTQGLILYTGLTNATSYTATGLCVDNALTKPMANGRMLSSALKSKQFKNIFLMFGVNELGWAYPQIFFDTYQSLIEEIKKDQPGATIYVQSILPVSKEKSDKDATVNNGHIKQWNETLKQMCTQINVPYLDVAQVVANENGELPPGSSTDGVHLNKEYCIKWLDYLKTHMM